MTAAAHAAITAYANLTVTLPCGRVVLVDPLDGTAQKRLTPNPDGKIPDPQGAVTDVLARCVKQVDGKKYDPKRMRDEMMRLPAGSRMRAFSAARMLTYSSECRVEWKCRVEGDDDKPCNTENSVLKHLDEMPDTRYDAGFLAQGLTVSLASRTGATYAVRLVVDTGTTGAAFSAALTRGDVSVLDAPLAQVAEIDGAAVKLTDVLTRLPGDVLDAVRSLVNAMEPRVFATDAARDAWVRKINDLCRVLGLPVPDDEEPAEGEEPTAPTLWLPSGGMAMRFQMACATCGKPTWVSLGSQADFLFRHLRAVMDE